MSHRDKQMLEDDWWHCPAIEREDTRARAEENHRGMVNQKLKSPQICWICRFLGRTHRRPRLKHEVRPPEHVFHRVNSFVRPSLLIRSTDAWWKLFVLCGHDVDAFTPQIPLSVGRSYIICRDQVRNIPLRQQDQKIEVEEEEEGAEVAWAQTHPSGPCQVSRLPGWMMSIHVRWRWERN